MASPGFGARRAHARVTGRQLSTFSRCQTLYRSKCTEKILNRCKSRGHVPQCPIAGDANVLYEAKTVFTRSAITPPKVKRFGWKLKQCEPNVGLTLADFGRDPRSSDSLKGIVFPKKTQKLVTKFPGLATSGRHNSAVITKAENLQPNGPPNGCLVSIFTVRITSKLFLWTVRCAPERDLPKFSTTSVVRYCPIVRCSAGAAQSHR